MSVNPSPIIRTADASGNVRGLGMSGVGFVILPMSSDAQFPVTVRLDNSSESEKNPTVRDSSRFIYAKGFEELELRGAVPGSKWTAVVLTEHGDDYKFASTVLDPLSRYPIVTERPGQLVQIDQYTMTDADIQAAGSLTYKQGSGFVAFAPGVTFYDVSSYMGVLLIAEDGFAVNGGSSPTIQWLLRSAIPGTTSATTPLVAANTMNTSTSATALGSAQAAIVNINPYLPSAVGIRSAQGSTRPTSIAVAITIAGTPPTGWTGTKGRFTLYGYN